MNPRTVATILAGVVIALAAGVACDRGSSSTAPSPTASASATATASPTATTPTATSTPTESPPAPAARADIEDAEYATVVPDWIPGLGTQSDSGQGAPYNYFVTWPTIESYPTLGDALATEVGAIEDDFAEQVGESIPGSPVKQELNVEFDFLAASNGVIGVRLQIFEFPGGGAANRSDTLWFDLDAGGGALPAANLLLDDAALEQLAQMVQEALRRDRPDLSIPIGIEEGAAPTAENYHSMGFTSDGDLLVEFDEYQVGPGSSGSPRVVVAADSIAPLLSDFGRRAQQEAIQPSRELVLPLPTPPPTAPPEAHAPDAPIDCAVIACIALTFDDGPGGPTPRLLDILEARHVHVTFFVVGVNTVHQPQVVTRIAAAGHEIGNHTFEHRDLSKLDEPGIRAQISEASTAVVGATGVAPTLLRPPYGAINDTVRAGAGMPLILWSIDPRDWADHDAGLIASRVLADATRGDIVLLHDIHETSVDAVPAILDGFAERGLTPVTISQLLGPNLEAGRVYTRGSVN